MCKVTQFVLPYRVKKTQIQRLLPASFHALSGNMRLIVEIMYDVKWLEGRDCIRIELNSPVSHDDTRGWFNLVTWENCYITDSKYRDTPVNTAARAIISSIKGEMSSSFTVWNEKSDVPFLEIHFDKTGEFGGSPYDEDNEGNFYYSRVNDREICYFKPVEVIVENQEYCECSFDWERDQIATIPRKYKHLPRICGLEVEEIKQGYTVTFDREIDEDRYSLLIDRELTK